MHPNRWTINNSFGLQRIGRQLGISDRIEDGEGSENSKAIMRIGGGNEGELGSSRALYETTRESTRGNLSRLCNSFKQARGLWQFLWSCLRAATTPKSAGKAAHTHRYHKCLHLPPSVAPPLRSPSPTVMPLSAILCLASHMMQRVYSLFFSRDLQPGIPQPVTLRQPYFTRRGVLRRRAQNLSPCRFICIIFSIYFFFVVVFLVLTWVTVVHDARSIIDPTLWGEPGVRIPRCPDV